MQTPQEIAGHSIAGASFLGWLAGVLPVAATAVTFIWFSILIVEKVTGKAFVEIVRCARERLQSMWLHR